MKKLFATLLTVTAAFAFANAQSFPNVKIENQKGESFATESLVDNQTPFVVSFWSTTCKPCIKELDAISEALEEWSEEVEVRIVAVSIDDSRSVARARALATGRGWNDFVLLYDLNQEFKRALNVINTPQVFIFDKNGKQVFAHTGYTPGNEEELIEQLRKLKSTK